MAFTTIDKERNEAGKALSQAWGDDVVDNLEFLNGLIGALESGQVLNGSFEINSNPDEPNLPDSWTRTLYPGGTGVIDTTSPRSGAQIYKFTHPSGSGNGGGDLLSDFIECGPDRGYALEWVHWATVAGVHVTVRIKYYTAAQAFISNQDLFDASSGIVSSAFRYAEYLVIPLTARYMRVQLIGGDTDTDPGSSTDIYFDDVRFTSNRAFGPGEYTIATGAGGTSVPGGGLVTVYSSIVHRGGTLRIKYDYAYTGSGDVANIYKNDVAVGTGRTSSATFEEDIPNWQPGDSIKIKINDVAGVGSTVSNVEIKASSQMDTN